MRCHGSAIAMLLFSICLVMGGLSRAEADTYLGEFCWQSQKTEDENGPVTDVPYLHKMRISESGGVFHVTSITEMPGYDPLVGTGSVVVAGAKILGTTTQTLDHSPWLVSGIVRMSLDVSNLNGTFWFVRNNFNSTTRTYNSEYGAGTMTFTACPSQVE